MEKQSLKLNFEFKREKGLITADDMTLAKDIEKGYSSQGAVPRSHESVYTSSSSGQNDRADMTLHVAKSCFLPLLATQRQ